MSDMNIVGFDFGTTNSLISVIKGDRAINLLDEEGLPFPSVVRYEGAKTIVGRKAKECLGEAGLGVLGNTVRSPKVLLGREGVFIEGVEHNPVDIVADVVKYVSQQSLRRREIGSLDRAVVTIPIDMEGYRRAALRDAFRIAGITIEQFIHEPLAALYGFFLSQDDMAAALRHYDRKLMLVFDWGGGTLDLTLCRLIDGMLVQIANDGTDEVGGDIFDDVIMNEIIRRVQVARALNDSVEIHPESKIRLLHHCERAKIDLSTRNNIQIYVRGFFRGIEDEDLEYVLSRNVLTEITGELLDKGFRRISKLLKAADISPAQVAVCLATGGIANMPAIKARLHELFGAQRVQISERSATQTAEGAAWIAHNKARLQLAKNVELLLARNSYMQLIKATTIMPTEGEVQTDQFHLYCADPRDGHAKFQLCVPVVTGKKALPNDMRNTIANLIINVDAEARPFRERLELDVKVDDNLILKVQARSLNMKDIDETEVHNLEFGLELLDEQPALEDQTNDTQICEQDIQSQLGGLAYRSNITNRKDNFLIPGELLNSYDKGYFDVRNNPPQFQVEEVLYYQPCSLCGKASNDPLCRCSSRINMVK